MVIVMGVGVVVYGGVVVVGLEWSGLVVCVCFDLEMLIIEVEDKGGSY